MSRLSLQQECSDLLEAGCVRPERRGVQEHTVDDGDKQSASGVKRSVLAREKSTNGGRLRAFSSELSTNVALVHEV